MSEVCEHGISLTVPDWDLLEITLCEPCDKAFHLQEGAWIQHYQTAAYLVAPEEWAGLAEMLYLIGNEVLIGYWPGSIHVR